MASRMRVSHEAILPRTAGAEAGAEAGTEDPSRLDFGLSTELYNLLDVHQVPHTFRQWLCSVDFLTVRDFVREAGPEDHVDAKLVDMCGISYDFGEKAKVRLAWLAAWRAVCRAPTHSPDVSTFGTKDEPSVSQLEQVRQLRQQKHQKYLAIQADSSWDAEGKRLAEEDYQRYVATASSLHPTHEMTAKNLELHNRATAASTPPTGHEQQAISGWLRVPTGYEQPTLECVPDHIAELTGLRKACDLAGWDASHVLQLVLEFQRMLVGRSMMAGFGAAHPGDGLHRCLFDLLTFNEATCSKKKSSFQDMRRMPDAPYKRDCQFVPCFFWGSGCSPSASCSPVLPGEPGRWWPMLVAPWGPPSWPIVPGVINADIRWAYCPALAANGARPWPVHRDRLLIVTAALLLGCCQLLQADTVGASTPCTNKAKATIDGNAGDNVAASTIFDDAGSNTGNSSADHSWIDAASSANHSWVEVGDELDAWHEPYDSEAESF